jgi:hypothetical protein
MTTATRTTLDVRIIGGRLPGRRWSRYDSIHVGVQRKAEVVGLVPGDAGQALFDLRAGWPVVRRGPPTTGAVAGLAAPGGPARAGRRPARRREVR